MARAKVFVGVACLDFDLQSIPFRVGILEKLDTRIFKFLYQDTA